VKQKRFQILMSLALCLSPWGARSVGAPDGSALSLARAIEKALANNPEIRAAEAASQTARLTSRESETQRLPKISLAGQYLTSDDIRRQLPDSNAAVVRGDEYLFQGGRLAADVQRLHSLEKSAAADLEAKRLEVMLAVEESFFRALADQEQLDDWAQARSEYARLLKLIEPRFTLGSIPEYDYVKIKISLAEYDRGSSESGRALEHERFVLGALMGTRPPQLLQALPPLEPPAAANLETLMEKLALRPDVQAAESRLAAQRFALQRARRERLPDLRLSGDYGYSGQSPSDVAIGWGFSTAASLPVFDFGTIRAHIAQARSEQSALEYQNEALRLKIRTELNDALEAVQAAWENLQTAQQNISLAQKAYESSLRRYRTGLAAMTELGDAHDLLIQSRLRLCQAAADYRGAQAQLSASQGVLGSRP